MRRRLLVLVFSTTLFALAVLSVTLFSFIWALMGPAEQLRANQTARVAASGLAVAVKAGAPVTDATLEQYVRDEAVLSATLPDGTQLSSGPPPEGPTYTWTSSNSGVSVTARIPQSYLMHRVVGQALLTVTLSAFALAVAMFVASTAARRITRPLEDFAEMAARIGTGDRRSAGRRYGIPELDAVAEVLDRSVSDFNALLDSERRVTTDASHQLRTPLTALSLRLEEILASDDLEEIHAEATAALGQVERLSGVVNEVVGVTRGTRAAEREPIDLDRLVASQITEWTPAFQAAGRRLARLGTTGLVAQGMPGPEAQALATLIENSLTHGAGTTTIRMRASGTWVVLEVSDRGPGVPEELEALVFERNVSGSRSSGLGLSLARTLVAADGGRLEMLTARPAVFAMFLPAAPLRSEPPRSAPASRDGRAGDAPPIGSDPVSQSVVARVSSPAASASAGKTHRL